MTCGCRPASEWRLTLWLSLPLSTCSRLFLTSRLTWSPQLRQPKKAGDLLESMFLLFLVAAQASASPVVVPGGDLLLPGHQNLLRSIALPYYPVYPFINWRLITQGVVIDIDVDYTCEKEVCIHGIPWTFVTSVIPSVTCMKCTMQAKLIYIRAFSSTKRIVEATLCATTMGQD